MILRRHNFVEDISIICGFERDREFIPDNLANIFCFEILILNSLTAISDFGFHGTHYGRASKIVVKTT